MKDKKLFSEIRSKEIGTSVKVIPERSSVKRSVEKSFPCVVCPAVGQVEYCKQYGCRAEKL